MTKASSSVKSRELMIQRPDLPLSFRSTPRREQTNRLRIIHQTQKPHRKGDCRRFYLIM